MSVDLNKKIKEIAREIQENADRSHCASAVFGVEKWLEGKKTDKYQEEIQKLYLTLKENYEMGDIENANDCLRQIRNIEAEKNKIRSKFVLVYAPIGKEKFARNIKKSGVDYSTIVLPRELQAIFYNGIDYDNNQVSIKGSAAKQTLRFLTLHELGHEIVEIAFAEDGLEEETRECLSREFAKDLSEFRDRRPKSDKGS